MINLETLIIPLIINTVVTMTGQVNFPVSLLPDLGDCGNESLSERILSVSAGPAISAAPDRLHSLATHSGAQPTPVFHHSQTSSLSSL